MAVAKTRNNGAWTEARFKSFIVSALRRTSARWGPKNTAKRKKRHHEKLPNPATGRLVFHSVCDGCSAVVPETTSAVDHINPVVDPEIGFVDWNTYIERMFCEEDGFQVLCDTCHSAKTLKERNIATERKRRERALQSQ